MTLLPQHTQYYTCWRRRRLRQFKEKFKSHLNLDSPGTIKTSHWVTMLHDRLPVFFPLYIFIARFCHVYEQRWVPVDREISCNFSSFDCLLPSSANHWSIIRTNTRFHWYFSSLPAPLHLPRHTFGNQIPSSQEQIPSADLGGNLYWFFHRTISINIGACSLYIRVKL